MVSTRRTPSRIDSLAQGINLTSKLSSLRPKRTTVSHQSLHYDISEPEASSDTSSSDAFDGSSPPPPARKKRSSQVVIPTRSRSDLNAPPRKRLRAIENLPLKSLISKSVSQPQSLSKTLTSLCDKLVVRETPKGKISCEFSNVFSHARHLLSISSTGNVSSEEFLGHSKEVSKLKSFLSGRYAAISKLASTLGECSSTHRPGSLYISGPPGTGKTHMMNSILLNTNHEIGRALKTAGIQIHFINCVSLSTSSGISTTSSTSRSNGLDEHLWNQVAACLGISRSTQFSAKYPKIRDLVEAHVMENMIAPSIIILDEIDYLAASKLPLITPLLLLSQRSTDANFTVIGIANTLDLTTRFINSCPFSNDVDLIEPELIHCSPFGPNDMIEIAKQRLKLLYPSYSHPIEPDCPRSTPQKLFAISSVADPSRSDSSSIPLFHPAALQLCAKKVSSVTGDLRTFLSILRKLIDSLEQTVIRNDQFFQQSTTGQTSVLETPTKMRKFTRIISSSQLEPDFGKRSSENECRNARMSDPCNNLTPVTAPKVTPGDVVKYFKLSGILDQPAFITSQVECLRKLEDLNLHQSLVLVCLCVAWSREQQETNQVVNGIGRSKAYEVYRDCLKPADGYQKKNSFNIGITPVSESEWADLLESGLQTRGLVTCSHERSGLSSHPTTPSSFHNTQVLSPLKSPSKRKNVAFQRSVLCTPSKTKPIGLNSLCTPVKSSPARSSKLETLVAPVHSISVLIHAIHSLANRTEAPSDDGPKFSPEIINILNQMLISEEKRARILKKRKAAQMDEVEAIGRKGAFHRDDDDDVEQENIVQGRLVTAEDEGTCRD